MAEYVEREAVKRMFCRTTTQGMIAQNIIDLVPTADVVPAVHGRWTDSSDRPDTIICSQCDSAFDVWKHESKYFFYCPNCGAKMDKDTTDWLDTP